MLTIIVPFYNERESLIPLYQRLTESLNIIGDTYEILFIDDGSDDGGAKIADSLAKKDSHLKVVHQKRKGKGEALSVGIENSKGDIVIFMDADLQDDPQDIPLFLKKIEEGYDFVNGKRTTRKDNLIIKLYSNLANGFLKVALRSPFTDINCPFKAFRRSALQSVVLYGNNFRFIPLAIYYNGFKVTEIDVKNHPRKYGKSKFGIGKLFGGLFDTLTAFFLYKFSESPLHFFGPIGTIAFLGGTIILGYLGIERLFFGELLYRRPVLFLGMLLVIVGIQVVMTGIIGELIVYLNKKKSK